MFSSIRRLLKRRSIWRYRTVQVQYFPELDGGGTTLAYFFVNAVKELLASENKTQFEHVFEWCAGPGFIGNALLAENLCKRLTLADVNPRAVACAKATAMVNNVADKTDVYLSDNLKQIPHVSKFDLVVSAPPNYYGLNPDHPYYERFKKDLRPTDPRWALHRDFYSGIAMHLKPEAQLLIQEISVNSSEIWTPEFDVPYDIRPRPAIDDFKEMIANGGLIFQRTYPLCTMPGGFYCDIVQSRKA